MYLYYQVDLLKESSSTATEDMDVHAGDSAYVPQLSMTVDHAWDSLEKKRVKLALDYGYYQRVEHLKHLRSMMETRKFGK